RQAAVAPGHGVRGHGRLCMRAASRQDRSTAGGHPCRLLIGFLPEFGRKHDALFRKTWSRSGSVSGSGARSDAAAHTSARPDPGAAGEADMPARKPRTSPAPPDGEPKLPPTDRDSSGKSSVSEVQDPAIPGDAETGGRIADDTVVDEAGQIRKKDKPVDL